MDISRNLSNLSTDVFTGIPIAVQATQNGAVIPRELLARPFFDIASARECGLDDRALRLAINAGQLHRLKRGWFAPAASVRNPIESHLLRVRVELLDHPDTVPSHHSAALVLGLPLHRPRLDRIHLMRTVAGRAQVRDGVVLHQQVGEASALDAGLTCVQVALHDETSGLMALDAALTRGLTRRADFHRWADEVGHHAGRARLSVVAALADPRRESPLESRTALVFHRWGYRLEPQFEIQGTPYRADARLRGTRVLVESDGLGKYDDPGATRAEKVREDDLRSLGWEVVRVTTALLDEQTTLLARLRSAIGRSTRRIHEAA